MILYKILTEDLNREEVYRMVSALFNGFTVYQASGFWKGNAELSLVIEIIAENYDRHQIVALCEAIKQHNRQQCVMLVKIPVEMELI
jgi:hypothetical protein